jgi:peptidyl-prolyl cis-trans isomerase A (cyclophilin A)
MTNSRICAAALALALPLLLAQGSLADEPAAEAPAKPAKKAKAAKPAASALLLAPEKATAKAPEQFNVKFVTSKGEFVLEVHRDWSPKGADRFFNLVKAGYYDDVRFFRVISGFMVQFGIHGTPAVNGKWKDANIEDDALGKASNERGMVSFATAGPNTRTTQVFINFGNNKRLDGMGFTPFAKVVKGMEVVDALHAGYGEGAPSGRGPDQERINNEGNDYLKKEFAALDYVKKATISK